ncbi:MAG: MopE-related protein [Bacteroidales bacterium]
MKKIFTLLIGIMFSITSLKAQDAPPQAFSYKAVIRKTSGAPVTLQNISLRISIYQNNIRIPVYTEKFTTITSIFGEASIEIGNGTDKIGVFSEIKWGEDIFFLKVEVDIKGGRNYQEISTTQLLSVPYALYAGKAGNSGDYNDLENKPTNLSQFYNDLSFLETDPVFGGHPAKGISNTMIGNWNTAFGWGDHSTAGYLKSFTETDPVFGGHPAKGISNTMIGNWNTAFNWGNHSAAGYLLTEVDGSITNEIQILNLSNHLLSLSLNGTSEPIDLSSYMDNTDNQKLTVEGKTLTIENGNTVALNTDDLDADPTNEIQTLSIEGDVISLTNGGNVVIPAANNVNGLFFYGDKDRDGFGDLYKALWTPSNVSPPNGYITNSTDCDDSNFAIKPGATEYCDGIDNNCDNRTDESCIDAACYSQLTDLFNCIKESGCQLNDWDCIMSSCTVILVQLMYCEDADCYRSQILSGTLPFDETWTAEAKADYIMTKCISPDADKDGYTIKQGDCNDADATIHPNAVEICGDGIDQDCNDRDAVCGDIDGDGYSPSMGDCDDNNAEINPGAPDEECDGIDNNCNGEIDEQASKFYLDADGDGYGNPEISRSLCEDTTEEYVENNEDCNDSDPLIHPKAVEICDDGIDQDCSGSDLPCTALTDDDVDGYSEVNGDCNDSDPSIHPGATEICGDGIDQDCDGNPNTGCCNELLVQLFDCMDSKDCSLNDFNCIASKCAAEISSINCVEIGCIQSLLLDPNLPFNETWTSTMKADYLISKCGTQDKDGDGFSPSQGDCNDADPTINPNAVEVCSDLIDQNCNGTDASCDDVDEDGYTIAGGDCDDNNRFAYPGAPELCDGKDNDCDASIDEGAPVSTWYKDADGDGYGNEAEPFESCTAPEGYIDNPGDCNDGNSAINPSALEVCDGEDNDCDGQIDEEIIAPPSNLTVGVCTGSVKVCGGSSGWIEPDYNMVLNYEPTETTCDGLDNDCDGEIDEGCAPIDADGDGYTIAEEDCDDTNAAIHPGATEICGDGIDQDCNGSDLSCDPNANWQPGDPWIDPQDGHSYKTIQYGYSVWMAENLRAMKYNDGNSISPITDKQEWEGDFIGGYCWYENDYASNGNTYGALYNWYAVSSNKLCPIGWHVSNITEWEVMISSLGGANVAGDKLKEESTTHWESPNTGATNEISFTALPGGERNFNGDFMGLNSLAVWWTSITSNISGIYYYIDSSNSVVLSGTPFGENPNDGYSVRCVKDY